ncbi:MAG: DMT family transporter [Desulfurococcales archaeon]|nr:DMT family transporter [Desulfurococcales archaeon]
MRRALLTGSILLVGTTLLWGTSFPAIKYTVTRIGPLTYVWVRSLIAAAGLSPYLAYAALRGRPLRASLEGGLATGVAFAVGLWLQGWGTRYTTASNSAFITGLNTVFVHIYTAIVERDYSPGLAASLAMALAGLYLLTRPEGGLGLGDALVLLGAVAWAAQIILVDRYARGSDPVAFTFAEMLPSIALALPALAVEGPPRLDPGLLLVLAYLGLACADAAFILQVMGQKRVPPALAALIFLLEPVFAAVFSAALLGERFTGGQLAGMALIIAGIAASEEAYRPRGARG